METSDIINYLNTLVKSDPTLSIETKTVIAEAIIKLKQPLSVEDTIQIIMLFVSLLDLGFKLNGS